MNNEACLARLKEYESKIRPMTISMHDTILDAIEFFEIAIKKDVQQAIQKLYEKYDGCYNGDIRRMSCLQLIAKLFDE